MLLLLQEDERWLKEENNHQKMKSKFQYLWKKNCVFICIPKNTYERPISLDNNYSHVQAPYKGVFSISKITTFRLDSIF